MQEASAGVGPVIAGGRGRRRRDLHLGDPAISVLFINAPAASSAGHSGLPITPTSSQSIQKKNKKTHTQNE